MNSTFPSASRPALQAGGRRFESCTAHHLFDLLGGETTRETTEGWSSAAPFGATVEGKLQASNPEPSIRGNRCEPNPADFEICSATESHRRVERLAEIVGREK